MKTSGGIYIANRVGSIKSADVVSLAPDSVAIPAIGIPFVSPFQDNLDLHGEYFDKDTELGPLTQAIIYFNHNRFFPDTDDPDELQRSAILSRIFKGEVLGVAQKEETTQDGVLYNLILDLRKKYASMLLEAIENGLLDVSSGAKYYEIDSANRHRIAKWHVVEISLTPSPANPNATPIIAQKCVNLSEKSTFYMRGIGKMETKDTPNNTDPQVEGVNPIIEGVKQAFDGIEATNLPSAANGTETLIAEVAELRKQVSELQDAVSSIAQAMPYMAERMANILKGYSRQSSFEIEAEKRAPATQNSNPVVASPNSVPLFKGQPNSPRIRIPNFGG